MQPPPSKWTIRLANICASKLRHNRSSRSAGCRLTGLDNFVPTPPTRLLACFLRARMPLPPAASDCSSSCLPQPSWAAGCCIGRGRSRWAIRNSRSSFRRRSPSRCWAPESPRCRREASCPPSPIAPDRQRPPAAARPRCSARCAWWKPPPGGRWRSTYRTCTAGWITSGSRAGSVRHNRATRWPSASPGSPWPWRQICRGAAGPSCSTACWHCRCSPAASICWAMRWIWNTSIRRG